MSARVTTRADITLSSKRLGEFEPDSETADLLTADRLLDRTQLSRPEPEGYWQQLIYALSGRRINLGDSRKAQARKGLDRRIGAPLPGAARFVPVVSRKGGVGKTTVTALLGMARRPTPIWGAATPARPGSSTVSSRSRTRERTPSSMTSIVALGARSTGSPKTRIARTAMSGSRRRGPQALHHDRGELACGVPGGGVQIAEHDRGPRGDVGVVRHAHHRPHARAEVRVELVQLHERGTRATAVEHHDGVPHAVGIAVRLEPGERFGREARFVDAQPGDEHELVGEFERGSHDRMHDAGAGVGEHDRVVVGGETRDVVIVASTECLRDLR